MTKEILDIMQDMAGQISELNSKVESLSAGKQTPQAGRVYKRSEIRNMKPNEYADNIKDLWRASLDERIIDDVAGAKRG